MKNQFAFAITNRFAPLFGTQFMGALNDNLFKTATFVLISFYGLGKSNTDIDPAQLLNIGALLFILPYFIFSSISGQICTRYDKAKVARVVKVMECIIMLYVAYGFYTSSLWILLSGLFFMGAQSTFFGPLKYSVLPEYLNNKELVAGNGLIEMGTFLAILLGQILGTVLAGLDSIYYVIGSILVIAIFGTITSFMMPSAPPQAPDTPIDLNILRSTWQILKASFANVQIKTAIIGISWFWLLGAVYTTQLPTFTKVHLGGTDDVFNLMLSLFSIGIGIGSIICAKLSHERVELGLVLMGATGMTVFGAWLGISTYTPYVGELQNISEFLNTASAYNVMLCITALGFFGGFFSVPLYTWLQTGCEEHFRSHAIAANNIVNGVFMMAAAGLSMLLLQKYNSIAILYMLVAIGNVLAMLILIKLYPAMWTNRWHWLKRK